MNEALTLIANKLADPGFRAGFGTCLAALGFGIAAYQCDAYRRSGVTRDFNEAVLSLLWFISALLFVMVIK